jgi:hypothetical protein
MTLRGLREWHFGGNRALARLSYALIATEPYLVCLFYQQLFVCDLTHHRFVEHSGGSFDIQYWRGDTDHIVFPNRIAPPT